MSSDILTLTGKDTGLPAYIFRSEVTKVETVSEAHGKRTRSFTRVHFRDDKAQHVYFLDIKEKESIVRESLKHGNKKQEMEGA